MNPVHPDQGSGFAPAHTALIIFKAQDQTFPLRHLPAARINRVLKWNGKPKKVNILDFHMVIPTANSNE
jgi:hypothetical protein